MENITLKKYFKSAVLNGSITLVLVMLIALCAVLNSFDVRALLIAVLAIVIGSQCFKDSSKYINYKKLCPILETGEGIITNWCLVSHSRWITHASVILKIDTLEYVSDAVFSSAEAEAMVGKKVKYAVSQNTLIVYEVL